MTKSFQHLPSALSSRRSNSNIVIHNNTFRYEHPYQIELDQYQPPSQFIDPQEPLPFPVPLEETMYTYVDTEAKLDALVEHLNTVSELAIDLEHHSYRTYQGHII